MAANNCRRCFSHDYRKPCVYMITLLKASDIPHFSVITQNPRFQKVAPIVTLSDTGKLIYEALGRMTLANPALHILRQIAMPDHLHFEIWVSDQTEKALGSYIAAFKVDCASSFNEKILKTTGKTPLFQKGFNDKIAFNTETRAAFFRYIADNPRRFLVKRHYPDYFKNKLDLELDGERLSLYGNIFLLDSPVKAFVKISRIKERTPNLAEKEQLWRETVRCGGVLVSPFINPEEKRYRDLAIEEGAGIILVQRHRYNTRSKPEKKLFQLCEEGRLLIISNSDIFEPPKKISYPEAQALNAIAAKVAALQPRKATLRRRQN